MKRQILLFSAVFLALTRSQVQDVSCGDTPSGTWDGVTNGQLTFELELTEAGTITWDAQGSGPNLNPVVAPLIQYTYNGALRGTSDNDDQAVYPDLEDGTSLLMELYNVPAGTYNLIFEGTEGQDTYSYTFSLECMFTSEPTPSPTPETDSPTDYPTPSPTPNPTTREPTTYPPTTNAPTTNAPTTESPTIEEGTPDPASDPTPRPTTKNPTPSPTTSPTLSPTRSPSQSPTSQPTDRPTPRPTPKPVTVVDSGGGSDSESDEGFIFDAQSEDTSNSGTTVWIIVSVVVVLVILAIAAMYVIRRRRADKHSFDDIEVDEMNNDIAVGTSVVGTAPYMGGGGVGEDEEIVVEVNLRD